MKTGESMLRRVDPIEAFVQRHAGSRSKSTPLVRLDIDVTVDGALALVETKRTYCNESKSPIEALLTFPVPVHAAFFGLTAKIGDRVLEAEAYAKEEARYEYEEAIEEGKAAVLHEEILRGVHMISLANLMPGASVEVTTCWAESLRCHGSIGRLRIPMTVGDVYGVSGLPESDDLTHGGASPPAFLRIRHDAQSAKVAASKLTLSDDGVLSGSIPANAPVDIEFEGWRAGIVTGKAHDGRMVSLDFQPSRAEGEDLSVALLVDHSGSMYARCSGVYEDLSSHEVAKRGLKALAKRLRPSDRLSLWEFDHTCNAVGTGLPLAPKEFAGQVDRLSDPSGGTEIGGALDEVIRSTERCDILLITDGMSYALDIQRLARKGRRIFVVLVGEDSLEANIGHLAALTGGETHFTFGADVSVALEAALHGLRGGRAGLTQKWSGDAPERVVTTRGNAQVEATWSGPAEESERDWRSAAAAAFATGLVLGAAPEDVAMRLAVSEGLVTHLTSLVLVDHAGERAEELPVTVKVDLPTPRAYSQIQAPIPTTRAAMDPTATMSPPYLAGALMPKSAPPSRDMEHPAMFLHEGLDLDHVLLQVRQLAVSIHWQKDGPALARCDIGCLLDEIGGEILRLAQHDFFADAGVTLGIDPIRVVLACVAKEAAEESRFANRVLLRLLRGVSEDAFREVTEALRMP